MAYDALIGVGCSSSFTDYREEVQGLLLVPGFGGTILNGVLVWVRFFHLQITTEQTTQLLNKIDQWMPCSHSQATLVQIFLSNLP
jgi:hypothetical protein